MDKNSIAMQWFRRTIGAPTVVQEPAWQEISRGHDTLVSAPTGTGKTLAAFLVFIDALSEKARAGELRDELHLIYVSPLKSLAGDIRENLNRPLLGIAELEDELSLPKGASKLRVAVRTGDTTSNERRKMINKPPHILITTPESLYLLLTSESGRGMLKTARALIIDELHAMISTKRGAHLTLSAARLDRLCGAPLQRIGLSATVAPLEIAAEYLSPAGAVVVAPPQEKNTEITVVSPFPESGVLPDGTVWPEIAKTVIKLCEGTRTAIAFCENRRHTEKLVYHIDELVGNEAVIDEYVGRPRGENPTSAKDRTSAAQGSSFKVATHHGSVSKERRAVVENMLRSGELRLLIATSSMELGIDVGEIDLVLQIGCPRGIASALQRLGRAGHRPGETSVMKIIPRTSAEGLYCALTAQAATEGRIERSRPPRLCLDVLAQHLTSMASAEDYTLETALEITASAYPFREITREDIDVVLKMLAGDYEHGRELPVRPRVIYDRINGTVSGDVYTRLLAVSSGGTIPDKGAFKVKAESGVILGDVDEEFTFEARVGDRFLLGAFSWQINNITRDTIYVSPASVSGSRPPFWKGDWSGRDLETGLRFGELLRYLSPLPEREAALQSLGMDEDSAHRASAYIDAQLELTDVLPDDKTIIAEHFTDDTGIGQLMIHSMYGRRVNAPLALLAREAMRSMTGMDIGVYDDNDGFLLFPYSEGGLPEGVLQAINIDSAAHLLEAILPETPLFSMAFRYNAGRALMMGTRRRERNPLWVSRLRAAETLEAVINKPEHPLIRETRRECLEDYWDIAGVMEILSRIRSGDIRVREVYTPVPSPFSLPLRRAAESELMYEYSPTPAGVHEAVAAARREELLPPSEARLSDLSASSPPPRDMEELHTRLMIEGEARAGELLSPADWFDKLARAGRIKYIEPGFWIAAEHEEEYAAALENGDFEAWLRIVRRTLRYRGGMDCAAVAERFFLETEEASRLLEELSRTEQAVDAAGIFYHADVYERARRATISDRRRAAETVPAERYCGVMLRRRTVPAPPEEQVTTSLLRLMGGRLDLETLETVILPARVRGYRAELLDRALAGGELLWQYHGGAEVSFHAYDDIDYDAELELPDDLSEEELEVLEFLKRRGASFLRSMPLATHIPVSQVLFSLIERGLVRCDSFMPLRRFSDREPRSPAEVKRQIKARTAALAGRFELARPLKTLPTDELLWRLMENEAILCRETARGHVDWGAALEHLRIWELTGQVRRGYFVEGLGGAQFINEREAEAVTLALLSENRDITWISAIDPALKWGKTVKHYEGRAFTAVAGTAVALRGGLPVAVFERRGAVLRLFDGADAETLLAEFVREFSLGSIFADAKRITVRDYPPEAVDALQSAGFSRQMKDFVLYRSAV